jgi:nucleoside 2-deoxyribosyltransferase
MTSQEKLKKVYISVSFDHRNKLITELDSIKKALVENDFEPWVFVEHYSFLAKEENVMMKTALKDIEESAFLIAETSEKGIGIGIEAGFAKGKNKTVVYIRNQNASHSTTLSGLSDYQIFYKNSDDLYQQIQAVLFQLKSR